MTNTTVLHASSHNRYNQVTTITTRRHPVKFYATLIFGFLFLCALGSALLFKTFNSMPKEQLTIKEYFALVFGLSVFFVAFSLVYAYWKNSPEITVDKHTIKIGKQTFYLKDIKEITLTGKMPFRCIIPFFMEGAAILLHDGTEKILFNDMYSNTPELKSFLEQVVLRKQEYQPVHTYSTGKNDIQSGDEEIFKGNQFTSLRGITLWTIIGLFAFLLFVMWPEPPLALIIFGGAFCIFWFTVNSLLMYYFGLAKDCLVVRNHNFVWKATIYQLSDIKEVVFESQGNQPNCMRVITVDFRNKLYPAGTLRKKTWLNLKDMLETKGVAVRNECIF